MKLMYFGTDVSRLCDFADIELDVGTPACFLLLLLIIHRRLVDDSDDSLAVLHAMPGIWGWGEGTVWTSEGALIQRRHFFKRLRWFGKGHLLSELHVPHEQCLTGIFCFFYQHLAIFPTTKACLLCATPASTYRVQSPGFPKLGRGKEQSQSSSQPKQGFIFLFSFFFSFSFFLFLSLIFSSVFVSFFFSFFSSSVLFLTYREQQVKRQMRAKLLSRSVKSSGCVCWSLCSPTCKKINSVYTLCQD